ncbi:nucleotide-binding domain-containing protein [Pseudomonas sp. 10S4]|uniref:nucleotide-binding domain-containing protein n=1 Tax=Pseudomonas sp. 10S4 TaxID=3048583 RepID=UPI002AC9ECC3|nr:MULTISPECIES: adenylate/guanylate cyclase domain-containing protein [unclassified Pseudomonas]MEB0222914.1 adenylate/guanylate cyclase domain-containing protein [Pseudomonas sp. 5S1]MEB0293041.1 adenylate/guanylate cyclase domain-containing protein [Pseudomonas sp. 10S4]WPX17218.1 adenylate/guanylate cyclase domain-containing protein [Pseudomonas sp. 10S4]
MSSLKDVYKSFDSVFDRTLTKSMQSRSMVFESVTGNTAYAMDSQQFLDSAAGAEFGIQQAIRGLFGKKDINPHSIGGHPHFDHLKEPGAIEYGFNVSLFMDIKGSTKLGLIYSPEEVFFIKNTIIRCTIETIRAFDGHVHRIMGDAVLAFFRGDGVSARNAAIDAVNCGCYLVEFMRQLVAPKLRDNNVAEDVGIRVGVDYGQHDKVLWGMYGFEGSSEVTATSFYVDVAAKLQQAAPRNRVMIGESLKSLLDLHDGVVELKKVKEAGEDIFERFIYPNYTGADGKPVNYRKFVLSQKHYFGLLPKPEWSHAPIQLAAVLKANKDAIGTGENYYPCSRSIPKGQGIEFKARFKMPKTAGKVTVNFRVTNHGNDAESLGLTHCKYEDEVEPAYNHERGEYFAKYWRDTAYTGLHYMSVSVLIDGTIYLREQDFGVYIGANS